MYLKIKADQLSARKSKDTLTTNLLTTLLSEIQKRAKDDNNREVTDDDCLTVIKKFISNLNELLANRKDDDSEKELIILKAYLPQQLTEEKIKDILLDLIKNTPNIKIGAIMGHFKQTYPGQYDGKQLSKIIQEVTKN